TRRTADGRGAVGMRYQGPEWRPLSGPALLERLRVTGRARPVADQTFAADLRGLLESGLPDRAESGERADGGRLVVTKDQLSRVLACPGHRTVSRFGDRTFTIPMACGALVDALFRQIVTVGTVGDPLGDALDGLGTDERQSGLVSWISDLAPSDMAELRVEVERQAEGLVRRWPPLDPLWLPRTQESMRAMLARGTIELSARVDLAIGRPAEDHASVAIVEVKSGARRSTHRDDLRFYALVEALRSPAPPFAVATYYSRTGEVDVESVTHDVLVEAARRCLTGIRALAGAQSEADTGAWCSACSVLPRTSAAAGPTVAADATVVPIARGQAA
ncbi:MAG TPA: PD-(D/E)XK nuclease family protein, partial [Acidimicrobiales bacterium]